MQRLEDSGAVRPIYGSLGVKRLILLLRLLSAYKFQTEWFALEWQSGRVAEFLLLSSRHNTFFLCCNRCLLLRYHCSEQQYLRFILHLHRALNKATQSANQHMHTFNYYLLKFI